MKKTKKIIVGIIVAMGLYGCSFEGSQYSPEQVINNALEETTDFPSYYGEAEMTFSGNGEEEHIIMKEWQDSEGKVRIEMESMVEESIVVSVRDGKSFTVYDESINQAFFSEDPELLSAISSSPKEQANQLLKIVRDTHTISIEGEEKVAGRTAYHLIAKANDNKSLLGDQELWIDQENWFVLKMISNSADNKVETVYTKMDLDFEVPADIFTLDLPNDIKVQNLDDMNETVEVTIEEAAESIGKPLVYFSEKEDREIEKIEMDELQGELTRKEINIEYEKDGLPLLTLSMFESPIDVDDDFAFPEEEKIEVRGQEGTFTNIENFRTLFWKEEGVTYSIILNDPSLTFDELLDWTNDMELVE